MGNILSNTKLAYQEIFNFWNDSALHSIQEFKEYLEEEGIRGVEMTHISSAVYRAQEKEELKRVERGIYKAGIRFEGNKEIYVRETSDLACVLKRTERALSTPVNLMGLNPREQELIPKLQELHQMCERILMELEDKSDDISK